MDFLDTYSIKARLFPALIAVLPAFVLFLLAGSWKDPGLPEVMTALGIGVLFYAMADLARRAGRRVQRKLFKESGGFPTNTELSHLDTTLDSGIKDRFRNFLAMQIGKAAPTRESEVADPAGASQFYGECYNFLRNNTYDTERFRVLFNENISYGFRRNLYGLKPYGIAINLLAVLAACWLYRYQPAFATLGQGQIFIQGGFALFHAIYFIFAVTKGTVLEASKTYARQLTMSCDVLIRDTKT
ncbi:hypothetical protein RB623_19960 [Mesorhizobium sp. LHD-90]|uniref:hypothetical protein n=1 Tax=Mesorhizobium sp. LHD-90 TaxID=3071414 RepID=UPI0027DFEE1E|nr:hypothetical protein [Mesorhizobium sp. LHD-90]MDQ6436339.1 hypothetical protein [Mesorhizobium sp. LHD-90]